jgi:5'-nucleotidase
MPVPRLTEAARTFIDKLEEKLGPLPEAVGEGLAARAHGRRTELNMEEVAGVILEAMPSISRAKKIAAAFDAAKTAVPGHKANGKSSLFLTQLNEAINRTRGAEPARRLTDAAAHPEVEPDFTLDVVFLGDSHSNLSRASRAATVYKMAKEVSPEAIMIHTGDALVGTPLYEVGDKGTAEMKILKAMGVEIYVPGNHDLDGGLAPFLRAMNVDKKMDVICANWKMNGPVSKRVKPYTVREIDGHKVVVIGLSVNPDDYGNPSSKIEYEDPVETLSRLIPEIKANEQPDAILVASHLGVYNDKQLAGYFPDVNAWIGGHSHAKTYYPDRRTHPDLSASYVMHAGADFEKIGVLALGMKDGRAVGKSGGLISIDEGVEPDEGVERLSKPLRKKLKAYSEVLVTLSNIVSGNSRSGADTKLGNMITDMLREELEPKYGFMDIAIFNRTGLRASLPRGEITLGNVFELFPFGNTACVVELTGAQVQEMLDNSASRRGDAVSGVTYTIRNGAAIDVKVNGKPLKARKKYKIATNSYMAKKGGSGYEVMLESKKVIDTGVELRKMLIDHFKKVDEISVPSKIETRTMVDSQDLGGTIRTNLGINDDGLRRDLFGFA